MKEILLDKNLAELESFVASLGERPYRAKQIMRWLMRGTEIEGMSDLSLALREKLTDAAATGLPRIRRKLVSAIDGTVKYLFELEDGQCVESVVMQYEHGRSICVSTQAGCRMGCAFCASTMDGLVRNLRAYEILGQIVAAGRDVGERIDGVVLMGIGEPLDNYDEVMRFLRLVGAPEGLNIGYRHISLSTCGLADRIRQLAGEGFPITLSISLHAVSDSERSEIMPIARRYSIDELMRACVYYFETTGRRISFEFTLIAGRNDDVDHARRLAALMKKYFGTSPCHVNLIPVNEVEGKSYRRSKSAAAFRDELIRRGVNATVRRTLGKDINASCGQLRRQAGSTAE